MLFILKVKNKMKKNVVIIGKGKWGNILKKNLIKLSNVKAHISREYETQNYKNIDWVFIATPNHTHEKIINHFKNFKLNVFCEKPLVESSELAKKIYKKYKKTSNKLYVSDLLCFKKKKIKLKKNNLIIRSKNANYGLRKILFNLAYHDFYFLFNILKKEKYKIKLNYKKRDLKIELICKNKIFLLKYDLKSKIKKHKFNNINMVKNDNPLMNMLLKLLNNKVNYKLNKDRSNFAIKLVEKIIQTNK